MRSSHPRGLTIEPRHSRSCFPSQHAARWRRHGRCRKPPCDDGDRGDQATRYLHHTLFAELFDAMNHALQDKRESAEECIRRARLILRISSSASTAVAARRFANVRANRIRGGLAPWRIRRVTTHIESNLDATIGIKDRAALAKLSYFHFFRAFRGTFGETPHGYLMRRRGERAQGLLLPT